MNTVLILGKGYIGKYLSVYLKQHNFDVYHLSKRDVDYTNPELLEQKIRQYNKKEHIEYMKLVKEKASLDKKYSKYF